MPLIDVTEVSLPPLDGAEFAGRSFDSPKTGQYFDGTDLLIEGWIVTRDSVARIDIQKDGRTIRSVLADGSRPDVASEFPDLSNAGRSGFRTAVSITDWAENRLVVLAATPGSERGTPIGEIRLRRTWREALAECETPLVSVVIFSGGSPWLLERAIASILAQSYPHFEVVLAGSNDHVSELASRYPGVRSVLQDSPGLSGARDIGLRRTVGDYVMFLDPADRLFPEALERGISAFREHPECAAVVGHRNPQASCADSVPIYRRSVFEAIDSFDPRRIASSFPVHCHHEAVAESYRWPARFASMWHRLTSRI